MAIAKVGQEFKIKNIYGIEVKVSFVEKEGTYYIRSNYRHGSTSETRHYAVSNIIDVVSTRDRAIDVWFLNRPGQKLFGAVYVINNHGEAVKVDDITETDMSW